MEGKKIWLLKKEYKQFMQNIKQQQTICAKQLTKQQLEYWGKGGMEVKEIIKYICKL